ncbi:hypothetical protein PPEP_a0608 [Pseudoalteromonas peptidolytica F12-50-A1]|uniref:Uncharacterized protein n=1 Tax=Pseudoalteromonas peptidolytica F12-50-A1 TaxID=1315280 RepID=A0A8I0MTQ5_9GAMM|nr:hypothetical protein [Pseudoalteromonas peptidolytica F12-50-A1]
MVANIKNIAGTPESDNNLLLTENLFNIDIFLLGNTKF